VSEAVHWRQAPPGEFAVIGDPVGHSWSPRLHRAALDALGRNESYRAILVPAEDFDEALDSLARMGYWGINCTIPHKAAAFAWARCIDEASLPYGALNTLNLRDRSGKNTDAPGFMETLVEQGIREPGPVLVLGAGGTARALVTALLRAGFIVRLHNRTRERAEQLAADVAGDVEVVDQPSISDHRLILNTTSAGLSGEALDIAWGKPDPGVVAYDVVYSTTPTPFLADASLAGLRTVDGTGMLIAQAALALEWWIGEPVSREAMRNALSAR
jgi:shikimate dehydrogenase